MNRLIGWIADLGASTLAQIQGLGRVARFGGHLVSAIPLRPTRFGFTPASGYGISCPFPVPDEAYMALQLVQGAGPDCRGVVRYRPEFDLI